LLLLLLLLLLFFVVVDVGAGGSAVFFTSVSFHRPEKSLLVHQETRMRDDNPAPESITSHSVIRLIE
jgi:hypothetical protein